MFYFVCLIVGLFCVIALGLGPLFFVLVGAAVAVLAFRRRLDRWWGLSCAAGGLALVLGVAIGWSARRVVEACIGTFLVVAAARFAGRMISRRAPMTGG